MCSGRVDMSFVFRAFMNGMDGVFVGGCRLGECNYTTHGNFHALGMVLMARRIMQHIGMNPERLRIEFMSSGEGIRFADVTNDFIKKIREIGPLGEGEGIKKADLTLNLEAVMRLVPYIRLVERERLRIPVRSEEAYRNFFASSEWEKLFRELVVDQLAKVQITLLLKERTLSTGEIAQRLGLTPSEVARHMNNAAKQGLVRYDEQKKRYALA